MTTRTTTTTSTAMTTKERERIKDVLRSMNIDPETVREDVFELLRED